MEEYGNVYDVGICTYDIPKIGYIYNKYLFSFGGLKGSINVGLIYSAYYNADDTFVDDANHFNALRGVKFSFYKKIVNVNAATKRLIECDGGTTYFYRYDDSTAFLANDGSYRVITIDDGVQTVCDKANNKEVYDSDGKLLFVYSNKYTVPSYTYFYNAVNGLLEKITDYDGNYLEITYDNGLISQLLLKKPNEAAPLKTVALSYDNSRLIVSYEEIKITLEPYGNNFSAYTTTSSGAYANYCSRIDVAYELGEFLIVKKVGSEIISSDRYYLRPTGDVTELIDHQDIHGVKTRYQYLGKNLEYAYEVKTIDSDMDGVFYNSSTMDHASMYEGSVVIHKKDTTFGKLNHNKTLDTVTFDDGSTCLATIKIPTTPNKTQLYLFSCWCKFPLNTSDEIHLSTNETLNNGCVIACYDVGNVSYDTNSWQFHSFEFEYTAENNETSKLLHVVTNHTRAQDGTLRDLRITPSSNQLSFSRAYLISYSDESDRIDLDDLSDVGYLKNGAYQSFSTSVSYQDIDAHMLSKKQGRNWLFNDYNKSVALDCNQVRFYVGTNPFAYNLEDYFLATETVSGDVTVTTYVKYNVANVFLRIQKFITIGSATKEITEDYDQNFNLINKYDDTITQTNVYNLDGFITSTKNTLENDVVYTLETFEYTENGNSPCSTTDYSNNPTFYDFQEPYGLLKKETSPTGREKEYVYDVQNSKITAVNFKKNADVLQSSITHNNGYVSALSQGGLNYAYGYAGGKINAVSLNGTALLSVTYESNEKNVTSDYGSYSITEQYDDYGRLISVSSGTTPILENTFVFEGNQGGTFTNASSPLATSLDYLAEEKTTYGYNSSEDILLSAIVVDSSTNAEKYTLGFTYDNRQRLLSETLSKNQVELRKWAQTYEKGENDPEADGRIKNTSCYINGVRKGHSNISYDGFKRATVITEKLGNGDYKIQTVYAAVGAQTSYLPSTISYSVKKNGETSFTAKRSTGYIYDGDGRISEEKNVATNEKERIYTYDSFGRLIREDNKTLNGTFVYAYDGIGNITSIKRYAYTEGEVSGTYSERVYEYDTTKVDRLTAFNGQSCVYDAYGNPTTYRGKRFTWQRGKLYNYSSGNLNVGVTNNYYRYNAKGQLIQKEYSYFPWKQNPVRYTSNRITNFVYGASGELLYEEITETVCENSIADTLTKRKEYIYDVNGVCGCIYTRDNGVATEYYYGKNVHGDILEVYDANGNMVCEYTYDAFGSSYVTDHLNDGFATENPFRYRGYYYDETLDLYYLSTRFYDPETGRFISPDTVDYIDPESVNGLNLYAYCNNDPINYVDPSGHLAISIGLLVAIGFGVGATIGAVSGVIGQYVSNGFSFNNFSWGLVAVDAIFGGIDGALSVTGLSVGASLAISPILAGTQSLISDCIMGNLDNGSVRRFFETAIFNMAIVGASSAFSKFAQIKIGYDGMKNVGIHNTSKNYLKTAKSARKIAQYMEKLKIVKSTIIQGTLGYAFMTTVANLGSIGLKQLIG